MGFRLVPKSNGVMAVYFALFRWIR